MLNDYYEIIIIINHIFLLNYAHQHMWFHTVNNQ